MMTNSTPPYEFRLEKIPDSDDLVLVLPDEFLADEGWQLGDTLKLEVDKSRGLVIQNKSKIDR